MSLSDPPAARSQGHIPDDLRLELRALLAQEPQATMTMTYNDFLAWATEDTLAEWVDGKIIMTSPAGLRHQQLAVFLHDILAAYTRLHDLGTVLIAPFQMKLGRSGREPDVLFVSRAHANRLQPTFLDGPADLVIEVISPESKGRDRGDKFYEYQDAGIPEYWLVDPEAHRVEFYQLDAAGLYQMIQPDSAGIYRSPVVPGFWIDLGWLWQEPLPGVNQVMLSVAGDDYARLLLDDLREKGFLSQ